MSSEETQVGAGESSPAPDGSVLLRFIADTERAHFRTIHDHGANPHAMMFWNMLRRHAGLSELTLEDLPAWCPVCALYHVKPHVQNNEGVGRGTAAGTRTHQPLVGRDLNNGQ